MSAPESFDHTALRLADQCGFSEYELQDVSLTGTEPGNRFVEFARAVAKWQAERDAEIADGIEHDAYNDGSIANAIRDEAAKL